ncbi:hypothetical protein [Bacillus sp. UNC438CL73TsuS30]|nr:hypothetical protein [Bacillus sp. UNC438CL73TsuS30]
MCKSLALSHLTDYLSYWSAETRLKVDGLFLVKLDGYHSIRLRYDLIIKK